MSNEVEKALTAQSETGDDWLVEMVAKEDAEFLNAGGKFHTIDVTPPRTEDATDAVALSKEDFERVKKALEMLPLHSCKGSKAVWINCRVKGSAMWGLHNVGDEFIESFEEMEELRQEALLILEKEIKP